MGKCLAGCDRPYVEIKVCDTCFHKDVCGDKDYLTENECSSYCDNKKLKAALEKQVAEQLSYEGDGCDNAGNIIFDTAICPTCKKIFEVGYDDNVNYCPECGQRLAETEESGNGNLR